MKKSSSLKPQGLKPIYLECSNYCLVVPFINPADHAPGVQVGHAPGVIGLHRLILGKNIKKIFFSETMRPRAFIFCVKQCLVSPSIIPANRDPGVQIGHAPGASLSAIGL